ncbi:hypothetical protein M426DRAFT_18659 [Hypoxylon sp. CI-4A]|nr:hypothetical protein M426DRAFT_18659 [Hypoxylon sp. CI-4A]
MAPTGGPRSPTRPDPNPTPSSDIQVAASNSTLKAWMRGRQPSWLANAKPVKPSPRPPQQSNEQPKTPVAVAVSVATGATETTEETTRPVVTEAQPKASVPVSATETATATAPPRRHQPPPSLGPQIQTQTSTSAANTVLPSPAPSDEPSPRSAESHLKAPVTSAHFVLDTTLYEPPNKLSQQRAPAAARERRKSRQEKEVSGSPRPPARTNMALNTPPTPNLPSINTNVASQEQPEQPPAKRQRIKNPGWQRLHDSNAPKLLKEYLQLHNDLYLPVERPRFQLLFDAVEDGDLFFVALHQLFCSWSLNRASVHSLCHESVHNHVLVDQGFSTMETVLKSNSNLRPEHLQWLASFPSPLPVIRTMDVYQSVLRQVLDFLVCVAHKWRKLHHDHQTTFYPFLMAELLDDLLLFSPILQAIIFRASRRSLAIADGPAALEMERIFKADQLKHRKADGTFMRKPDHAGYQTYNQGLVITYRNLIMKVLQSSQTIHQGTQQPNQSGASPIQQTGLSYPPHITTQMNYHVQQNPNQPTGFQPNMIPLRSNSAPNGSRVNQPPYLRSPAGNSPLVSSPAPMPGSPYVQSVPPQFTVPSNYAAPNSPITPGSYYPQATSPTFQTQYGNQANFQPDAVPTRPHHQQPQMQYMQQGGGHMAPAALRDPRNFDPRNLVGRHPGQLHPGQAVVQRAQSIQEINSQSRMLQQPIPSAQYPTTNTGAYNAPPNAVNAQSVSGYYPNHFQNSTPVPRPSISQPPKAIMDDNDRFFPLPGMRISPQNQPHSPYERSSVESALHQTHLRSPKRMPRDIDPAKSGRYYQAVKRLVLSPVATPPHPHLYKFQFDINELEFNRITRNEEIPGEHLPVNQFYSGSLRVRVRCCFKPKGSGAFTETNWVTADTTWPDHIFMQLNDCLLSVMRKVHHSKDLPCEASSLVLQGNNTLQVHIPVYAALPKNQEPHIAVELIETLSHSAVLRMIGTHYHMPANVTRDIIKGRLRGSSADDDLEMVDSLSIDLADPFSRTLFKVPARGSSCTHLECFDLETWLNSRLGKKLCCTGNPSCGNCPNEPSFVDKWKCPLCDKDARPYSLRIDQFLVEVRLQLEKENKLRTKAILVSSDGTWQPKEDPGDDDSDFDSDEVGATPVDKKPPKPTATIYQRERAPIEVIEIDD